MEILRRNTDYALRAVLTLAESTGKEPASARQIARRENISYQLTCKILQKLNEAKLVESSMGPKGGFQLRKKPSKINLLQVISAIQGPVRLNRCLLGVNKCPKQPDCPVSKKLAGLQNYIDSFLSGITLEELSHNKKATGKSEGRRK